MAYLYKTADNKREQASAAQKCRLLLLAAKFLLLHGAVSDIDG